MSNDIIATRMHVLRVGEPEQVQDVELQPTFFGIRAVVQPLFDGAEVEHVKVYWRGRYLDMFVDEMGALKRLPVNDAATDIYLNNLRCHQPDSRYLIDPPSIHGTAVWFEHPVWS